MDLFGKHYLVTSEQKQYLKRHYTVSNVMKREVYKEYIRVMNQAMETTSGNDLEFNEDLIYNSNEIIVTIKNYN
jgi:hypothetical protein